MLQLRRIKHEGWRLIGVDNPESVADHSLRAGKIAKDADLLEAAFTEKSIDNFFRLDKSQRKYYN